MKSVHVCIGARSRGGSYLLRGGSSSLTNGSFSATGFLFPLCCFLLQIDPQKRGHWPRAGGVTQSGSTASPVNRAGGAAPPCCSPLHQRLTALTPRTGRRSPTFIRAEEGGEKQRRRAGTTWGGDLLLPPPSVTHRRHKFYGIIKPASCLLQNYVMFSQGIMVI